MSSIHQTALKTKQSLKPYSQQIIEGYSNPFDCLTAYLMLECSEVLATGKRKSLELHSSDHPFFALILKTTINILDTPVYAHNAGRPQETLQSDHAQSSSTTQKGDSTMKHVLAAAILTVALATLVQANEISWSNTIRHVFEKHCIACHGSEAPEYAAFNKDKDAWLKKGSGMRMETYSHLVSFVGWPSTGALMRRLDDGKGSKDGKSGNMYQHLGASEEERQKNLALFKSWGGNWSLKRLPETSMEDLSGVKVKY